MVLSQVNKSIIVTKKPKGEILTTFKIENREENPYFIRNKKLLEFKYLYTYN